MFTSALLAASLVALLIGPVFVEVAQKRQGLLPLVDGFMIGTIGALVLFGIFPEAAEAIGASVIVAGLLGFLTLGLLESATRLSSRSVHRVFVVVAVVALLMHSIMDGVAVHAPDRDVAAGFILHRLPFAMGFWWLLKPRFGFRGAAFGLMAIGVATVVGFGLGPTAIAALTVPQVSFFQAFMGGALLHVLGHRVGDHHHGPDGQLHLGETLAMVLGVAAFSFTVHDEETQAMVGFFSRAWNILLEAAPALLFGYAIAGLIATFLPAQSARWLRGKSALGSAVRGTIFGLPLPVCSCGVVPLYQALVRKGAPPAAAVAFLIATPELGLDAVFLSIPMLGGPMAAARVIASIAVALAVGVVLHRFISPHDHDDEMVAASSAAGGESISVRLLQSLKTGFVDILDDTAAWIAVGIAIAAAIDIGSLQSAVMGMPAGLDVFLAALLGAPIYVCASGATPLAAALFAGGISPGAVLTFLIAGPATNITTLGVLTKLHSRKVAIIFALTILAGATSVGMLTNWIFTEFASATPPLEHHMEHSVLSTIAAIFLLLATAYSILRMSPSGFIHPILHFGGDDHDHEGHGHESHSHGEHAHEDNHEHNHEAAKAEAKSCCSKIEI